MSWDVDADIGLLEANADKVRTGLEAALIEHRLALVFSPKAYYYTIRPFVRVLGRRDEVLERVRRAAGNP